MVYRIDWCNRKQRRDRPRLFFGQPSSLVEIGLCRGWKRRLTNRGDLGSRRDEDKSEATTREFGTPFPDFPSPAGRGVVDIKLLPVADSITQLPRLRRALSRQLGFSGRAIRQPQMGIRHRELGIDLDSTAEERYARSRAGRHDHFHSGGIRFRASSDGVVASASGVESFSTAANDSPTRVLNL